MTDPAKIVLRAATSGDRPFLMALYGSGRAAEMACWGWSDAQREQFIAMQYTARCRHFDVTHPQRDDRIIEVAGRSAGLLSVDREETAIDVVDIAILPEFQGYGIGSSLLQEVQQEAARAGKTVRLHVLVENNAADRLYRRLGFECVAGDGVFRQLEWRAGPVRQAGGEYA